MTFTGRATRQGNTTNFGVGSAGAFTRAVSPLGDTLYVFLATGIVEITDLSNGSGTLTNYQGIPSSSDLGGAFEFGGSLYFTVRGNTNALRRFTNLSTGATENVASFGSGRSVSACATDGTNVWAYDSAENKLFRFNTTNWSLTEIGDVSFETGVTETGVQGMFYWAAEGRLYIIGGATDRLYRLPAFADSPTTWLAEAVDATVSQWGVNQQGVAGATVFDGEAYFLGGNPDALYRFERTLPLSIESIDEQNIPINTEDYELLIDIEGDPDRAYVDGDMEGFYHEWREADAQIAIIADDVTRLLRGAIWNVHLVKGTQTRDSEIIYNVVPVGPVFTDPGAQTLYRGHDFLLRTPVANDPRILRGSSLLVGLKSDKDSDDDGNIFLMNEGSLPSAANLTEASFMARQYAENEGGSDTLDVPITIVDDVYWRADLNYTRSGPSGRLVELIVTGPDGTVLPPTTDINADITGEGGATLTTVYNIDLSVYSSEGHPVGDPYIIASFMVVDLTRVSGTGSLRQYFEVEYAYRSSNSRDTIRGTTNASGDLRVHGSFANELIYDISSTYPVNIQLPGDDLVITSLSSPYVSYDSLNTDLRIDINDLRRTVTRTSSLRLPNVDYGTGYSRNIIVDGSGFRTDATLIFRFRIDGTLRTVEFPNFDIGVDRTETKYFRTDN